MESSRPNYEMNKILIAEEKTLEVKKGIKCGKVSVDPDIITAKNKTLDVIGKERTQMMGDTAIARLYIPGQNFMNIMQNEL
jgi:hypothetical protein